MTRRLIAPFLFVLVTIVTVGLLAPAMAQQPPAQQPPAKTAAPAATAKGAGMLATGSAVIQAIDTGTRAVTLKFDTGVVDTIIAGPDVQRFSELKVGDRINFKYMESVVLAIQQPGAKVPAPEASGIVRNQGGAPGAVAARRLTATVTIKAIDTAVPSVTVTKEDGSTLSVKVEDPKNLAGVKVGDKVQITYTQALAVSVETPAAAPKK